MAVQTVAGVEIAEGQRTALDYPNIRSVVLTPEQFAATPARTAGFALLIVHTIRKFERWLLDNAALVHGPIHSSIGQEAVAAGMALALERTDALTSTHRAHHDVVAKLMVHAAPVDFDPATADSVPAAMLDGVLRTFAEIIGLEQGLCGGRGGSMHLADADAGIMTTAIVGGGIPAAGGQALAARLRASGGVAVACFGDGATSIGAFHETATLARAWGLPMLFLLENNQYSVATTVRETAGFDDLVIRASGYDMPALVVDGMDPVAVMAAVAAAREHAVGRGPVFIEAQTYRYYHQNGPLPGSAFKYRTREEEARWATLDPVLVFPRRLIESGVLTANEAEHIEGLAQAAIDQCAAVVTEETPDGVRIKPTLFPTAADAGRGLLGAGVIGTPPELLDSTPAAGAEEITYQAAVSGVIARWLERDPATFVMGEDVGHFGGGIQGMTKDSVATNPERVLSTPICENGFTGAALGAALAGMHPIVELMYPDFALEAADQLFNHIAKARYMYGGTRAVPIVVRTQISRGKGVGPQHSSNPAAMFAAWPGWRVASPSTASEYIGLFNGAMLSRDPVLVIDDNRLMKVASPLPPAGLDYVIPPGVSRLVRSGSDVTVLSWGYALHRVVPVVEGLADQGISVEIIDPRWFDRASFDCEAVLNSVRRTGSLVIVEDSMPSQAMGGRILDYLLTDMFDYLRMAPVRVTGEDVYSPVSKPLETWVHLRDEGIERAIVAAAKGGRRRES